MRKQDPELNIITPQAADLLIRLHDGNMTLLYLYLCRTACKDRAQAARDLNFTTHQFSEAYERLEMHKLLPLVGADTRREEPVLPPIPAVSADPGIIPETPEYTSGDVAEREKSDPAFAALLQEAKLIVGRLLSTQDMIKLLGIYDHIDLPPEVVMELMHHVADVYRDKYGERRRPSVRAFEKEAYFWRECGITDFASAEEFIRRSREKRSLLGQVKEILEIHDREFSATEEKNVHAWIDMGFGADAIAIAYDRTVTNTGRRNIPYMNSILQRWHQKGLHTAQEIQEKDSSRNGKKTQSSESSADPNWIRKQLEDL